MTSLFRSPPPERSPDRMLPLRAARLAPWALGALLAAAFLFAAFHKPRTTFNVTASTERVEMWTGAELPPSRWVLDSVLVRESDTGAAAPFRGSLALADSVHVIIDRVAMGGLWVNVRSERRGRGAGWIYTPGGDLLRPTADHLDLFVPDLAARANSGKTVILALYGKVRVGRSVGINTAGSTAVLRSGKVTLIARSLFASDLYLAGSADLDAGDVVEVAELGGAASGFVVADERPALTAAYQVAGHRLVITRNGRGEYPLSATFLERLIRDRLSQAVSFVVAVLVVIASVAPLRDNLRAFWTPRANGPADQVQEGEEGQSAAGAGHDGR